jgi:uncharacterized membrane protein YciS (DUF1049 family)
MSREGEAVRLAYGLWRSESRLGTLVAVVLVVAFVGPAVLRFWRANRAAG